MTDITYDNLQNGSEVVSRRTFIKGLGIALAGSAFLAAGGQSLQALLPRQIVPGNVSRSMLEQHLGETFYIRSDSSAVIVVRLAEVRGLGIGADQDSRKTTSANAEHSFSALFRGPNDHSLGQGTYQFSHYQIGDFPLFIVPMLSYNNIRYYEAVFNRLPE